MYINKILKHFWTSAVDIINSLLLSIIAVIFQLRIFAHRIDAHYPECNVVSPLNELHAFVKLLKSMRVYIKGGREREREICKLSRISVAPPNEWAVDRFATRVYFIVQNRRRGFPKSAISEPQSTVLTGLGKFVERLYNLWCLEIMTRCAKITRFWKKEMTYP